MYQNHPPRTIIVGLKRYRVCGSLQQRFFKKVDSEVVANDYLKIASAAKKLKYELKSVICHFGDYGAGHYTTYIRAGDIVVKCDDRCVTESYIDENVFQNCYMLFYDRVNVMNTNLAKHVVNALHGTKGVDRLQQFWSNCVAGSCCQPKVGLIDSIYSHN